MFHSEFTNGYWIWDDEKNALFFNKTTEQEKPTFKAADENEDSTIISLEDTNATFSTVRFSDLISRVAQAQFRRYYKRRVRPGAVDVVTLQDIKDVVLFTAEVTDLSTEFIKFFHLPTTDAFLRASIVYFQYYFQVWEHVKERREEAKRKLTQPIVTVLEDIIMENLGDLRSILSREYHRLTCGMETELNRLIRTKVFNFIQRRPKKVDTFDLSSGEKRYIWGNACRDEKKLKHRSPAAQELMFAYHDYKMLAIGVRSIKTSDPRQKFLEIAYTAPEDKLFSLGVGLGILGYPRDRLDTLLQPRERTKTDVLGEELVVPPFDLPPKSDSKDEEFTQSLPQTKPLYTESEDTAKVRKSQANLWIRHVERCGNILFTDATSGSVQISIPES
ncbi:hypothetical protein WA026_007278 [Henosepilachna vigintioctopunctata]|uniref:Uncharacterized protein n=1 Tax=Henosepilachna vigintioctopunctata TaxID=420089 RepID=A0AAW1UX74_9CUCU